MNGWMDGMAIYNESGCRLCAQKKKKKTIVPLSVHQFLNASYKEIVLLY